MHERIMRQEHKSSSVQRLNRKHVWGVPISQNSFACENKNAREMKKNWDSPQGTVIRAPFTGAKTGEWWIGAHQSRHWSWQRQSRRKAKVPACHTARSCQSSSWSILSSAPRFQSPYWWAVGQKTQNTHYDEVTHKLSKGTGFLERETIKSKKKKKKLKTKKKKKA